MTFDEAIAALTEISRLAHAVAMNDEVLSPQDHVDLAVIGETVRNEVDGMYRDALKPAAIEALADMDAPYDEMLPSTVAHGVIRTRRRVGGRTEWAGYELCDALAQHVVERESGLIVRAVPVDRMRECVAACSDPKLTSSHWRIDGVRKYVNVDHFRRVDGATYVDSIEVVHYDPDTITAIVNEAE